MTRGPNFYKVSFRQLGKKYACPLEMKTCLAVEFQTGVSDWYQTGIRLVSDWYQTGTTDCLDTVATRATPGPPLPRSPLSHLKQACQLFMGVLTTTCWPWLVDLPAGAWQREAAQHVVQHAGAVECRRQPVAYLTII